MACGCGKKGKGVQREIPTSYRCLTCGDEEPYTAEGKVAATEHRDETGHIVSGIRRPRASRRTVSGSFKSGRA